MPLESGAAFVGFWPLPTAPRAPAQAWPLMSEFMLSIEPTAPEETALERGICAVNDIIRNIIQYYFSCI